MREARMHPLPLALGSACLAFAAAAWPADGDKGADVPALLRANARAEAEWARRRDDDLAARREFARSLRLDADGEDCVAFDPAAGTCQVTVDGFNRALAGQESGSPMGEPAPSSGDVDSARGAVLQGLLDEAYVRSGPMPWRAHDSLDAAYRQASQDRAQAFRARLGDSVLRAAYRGNFDRLFKGKRVARVRALSASDSAWLASALGASPPALWRLIDVDDLPPQVRAAALALKPGGVVGPMRVPFGFLSFRYGDRRNLPDTPYETALPLLIELCARPAASRPERDSGWAPDPSRSPEPASAFARFQVWLRPGPAAPPKAGRDPIGSDTAGLRPIECGERNLPPDIRGKLDAFRPLHPGEVLGPLGSDFGIWYFRVLTAPPGSRGRQAGTSGSPQPVASASPAEEAKAKEADLRTAMLGAYRQQGEDPSRRAAWKSSLILRFISLPETNPAAARKTDNGQDPDRLGSEAIQKQP